MLTSIMIYSMLSTSWRMPGLYIKTKKIIIVEMCTFLSLGGWGGGYSHMKQTGMPVGTLKETNLGVTQAYF